MRPDLVIIGKEFASDDSVTEVLDRLRGVEVRSSSRFWLTDPAYLEGDYQANMKRVLRLSDRAGDLARNCPGQRGMLCCSYHVFDSVLGCPADCHYCILQDVLRDLPITVNVKTGEILSNLSRYLDSRSDRFTRIGTGELSDSLMLESVTHFAEKTVPFFADQSRAVLELKTKSADVGVLEGLVSRGRTIVSLSLNPQVMIDRYESRTATLDERIKASSQCVSWGYPVGFHFDPILLEDGWESSYAEVVEKLKGAIDPGNVAWVSLGAFRFTGKLAAVIRERFPGSGLLAGGFAKCSDGKYRYPEELRVRAYKLLWEKLKSWSDDFPVYLCMEAPAIWEGATGERAPTPAELSRILDERAQSMSTIRG